MPKKTKRERKEQQTHYTRIDKHSRKDGKLKPPLTQLPVKPIDWPKDLIPEHLWIAALFRYYRSGSTAITYFDQFMNAIDPYMDKENKFIPLGYITDFGKVASPRRAEFLEKHRDLVHAAFHKPIGRMLAFFPDGPAYWLVLKDELEREGSLDPSVELQKLSNLTRDLYDGKSLGVGHLRTIPLNRLFVHDGIQLNSDLSVIPLLSKYADGCSSDEKYQVQQFARTVLNMRFMTESCYAEREWSKYFWRHNFDLVPCDSRTIDVSGVGADNYEKILGTIKRNDILVHEYLVELERCMRIDLYEPTRDEILLGLFSRISRLLLQILNDSNLWSLDAGGIFLRCMVETTITFAYLAQNGTPEDFDAFRTYGEGREKLLMLHFQDNYPEQKTRDGKTGAELAEGIGGGGFWPEFVDIDLGWWTKKSARELAISVGLEKFYRLIYDPTSADVHGTWTSLKSSNLVRCCQPLHRFHWLPSLGQRPLFIETVNRAQEIYTSAATIAQKSLATNMSPLILEPLTIDPAS